jgi:hypothetical protein
MQEMACAKTGLNIAPETGTSFRLSEILIFKSGISVAMLPQIPAAKHKSGRIKISAAEKNLLPNFFLQIY